MTQASLQRIKTETENKEKGMTDRRGKRWMDALGNREREEGVIVFCFPWLLGFKAALVTSLPCLYCSPLSLSPWL